LLRTRLSDFLLPALSDFRSSVYSYDSTFLWLSREDLRISQTAIAGRVLEARIQTVLCLPLLTSKGAVGTLDVGSRRDRAFSDHDQELLNQVAAQLAIALDHARAYRETLPCATKRLYFFSVWIKILGHNLWLGHCSRIQESLARAFFQHET